MFKRCRLLTMDTPRLKSQLHHRTFSVTHIERKAVELLSLLLADVITDVEVAARGLGISDAGFVRLRRALDRVSCAQTIMQSIDAEGAGTKNGDAVMRDALELLAREWREDYPAGAVGWLLLEPPVSDGHLRTSSMACDH
jgi:hypothetical protein